jgi:dTDP-4-dehydrorhamnose reductase
MKLLLLGSTGLLGPAIAAEASRRGHEVIGAARTGADIALDITDEERLRAALAAVEPDVVVNCAALTSVDDSERDPELAYRINARPLALLADWSKKISGRRLLQISTDHYFTAGGARPHAEGDAVDLVNEYARTKHAGEALALSSPNALVLRTAFVGIRNWPRPTLAEWAIRAILAGETLSLFDDAFTSCIDVGAVAQAALDLLEKGATGLLNVASRQVFTKGDLIREIARQLGRPLNSIPASIADLKPARPSSLGLDVSAAERRLGYRLPTLEEVVNAVLKQYQGCALA